MIASIAEQYDVTVGIPYFNGTKVEDLRKSIESILSQTYKKLVLHLVQDGPVNRELQELVDMYLGKHENIKHINICENRGLAHALNISILNATTKYYARMDSDDISHPDRIRQQYQFMESNLDIDILGTWIYEFYDDSAFDETLDFEGLDYEFQLIKSPQAKQDIEKMFHYRNPLCHMSVMFRKDVFARIGLYNARYRRTQDLELWSRALKANVGITNLPTPLVYVRAMDFAEKRSSFTGVLRQAKVRYKYNTLSPKYNLLKISALLFRLLPKNIRKWGYRRLRV